VGHRYKKREIEQLIYGLCLNESGCVKHILETMALHAFLKKTLTLRTRLGVAEMLLTCDTIFTDPHNIHITILQLGCVSKLLNTIPLSMNCIFAIATATATTTQTIGRNT
jgi:hypothetical protein